jgi:preprotein translocase subunit Sss1
VMSQAEIAGLVLAAVGVVGLAIAFMISKK